jgi:uncharacterized membrane protein YfcA
MEILWLSAAAFLAAMCSGTVGFGGAMLLLPVVTESVGAQAAVPVLTVVQVVSNGGRVACGGCEIDWRAVKLFLLTAVPFAILGALSFVAAPKYLLMKAIGLLILVFVLLKFFVIKNMKVRHKHLPWVGIIVGFISGLIGTAGPLGAAAFLSLNLSPVGFVSTDALSSLVMHLVKLVVYQQRAVLDEALYGCTIAMSAATLLGSFVGNKIAHHVPQSLFQKIATCFLIIAAIKLVVS